MALSKAAWLKVRFGSKAAISVGTLLGQFAKTDLVVIEGAFARLAGSEDVAIYVATRSAEVVGFVHVRLAVDYYLQTSQAHVADLVVAPSARGRGVASKLLKMAENWARNHGCSQLTIAVFERNAEALALYERRGFERETIRLLKLLA